MQVALWYMEVNLVFLIMLWVEERTKIFSVAADKAYDKLLEVWCRMMRHTGDPIYTYQPRRYR